MSNFNHGQKRHREFCQNLMKHHPKRKKKVYITGNMYDIPLDLVQQRFNKSSERLLESGFEPLNYFDKHEGDPRENPGQVASFILDSDMVLFLIGFDGDEMALAELSLTRRLGKKAIFQRLELIN